MNSFRRESPRKISRLRRIEMTVRSKEEVLEVLSKYGVILNESEGTITDSSHAFRMTKNEVSIEIWGSGKPMRKNLWSEKMADACVFLMENVDFKDTISQQLIANGQQPEIRNTHINIGTGKEISIKNLAELVKEKVGFKGKLYFNISKPDGTMRKLKDVSRLHGLGWHHQIEIEEGVERMYRWYTG